MQCDYFDAGVCRSCALMGVPYPTQLADTQRSVAAALHAHVPDELWDAPFSGPEQAFRNKAKLVVGGTRDAMTFGILDVAGQGVDLRHCGLYEPALAAAVPVLADLVAGSGLVPYDVPRRQGELKHVLVTASPDGELMVRLVLRSPGQLNRVRELLPLVREALPGTRVVSVNLQPEHKAVLEGDEEVVLTESTTLPMRVNDVTLHLGVRSFFQTNTQVASALYRDARHWVEPLDIRSVVDLYCGVGGFAHHLSAPGRSVTGVEISAEAVAAARLTDTTPPPTFVTGDATAYLRESPAPDLVVVNPPRRGIASLAMDLEGSDVAHALYSSCNAASLAKDLDAMPSFRPVRARLFDMFPQTNHSEILVLLTRT